jgi:ATP-dependent RNA helicase DHX29
MQLITGHDVTVICGETGCGKSTQVPQIILREQCKSVSSNGSDRTSSTFINIIVTEPRRLAAVSVSARVSVELGDYTSNSSGNSSNKNRSNDALCGYTVRLDSNVGPRNALEYVTNGVLLRRIQATSGQCLLGYSHGMSLVTSQ